MRLKQGTTTIASWTEPSPLPSVFTQKDYLIPADKIHQISNYDDLIVEFEAICEPTICTNDNADRETVSVSWMQLQYETTTTSRSHPPPTITGIGFYNITKVETGTSSQNNDTGEHNFPYSKQTDLADAQNYIKYKKLADSLTLITKSLHLLDK